MSQPPSAPSGKGRGNSDRQRNDRETTPDKGNRQNRGKRSGQRRTSGQNPSSGGSSPRHFSRQAPSQRKRQADPARLAAFRVLRAVSEDDAYANLVLPAEIRRRRLDKRDAGFATELTYGALRAQGQYDQIIAACVDRPLDKLDPPVLDALRIGTHQLLSMRVGAHAAIDETVALVRAEIGVGPSGFVNAVLRKVSSDDLEGWIGHLTAQSQHASGSDEDLALRYAHPGWVVRALKQSLRLHGREGELEQLLEADNAAPEVHLVGLPGLKGRVGESRLDEAVKSGAVASEHIEGAAVFRGGDLARLAGVREGELRIQDIGSQWIARALWAATSPSADVPQCPQVPRLLDLCAGPGGKAALLAALTAQSGGTLLANEPAPHRAELVEKALAPLPSKTWSVRKGDGRNIGEDLSSGEIEVLFTKILVDAPCTGLGALRRRPESRWRRSPQDLAALTVLQEELIDAAVAVLAPGGLLAYVTCSPHAAETVIQVEDALHRHPELELIDAHEPMSDVALPAGRELLHGRSEHETYRKTVQLWPHIHGTDAMFFALFHKPASSS